MNEEPSQHTREAKSKMFYLGADGSLNRTKKAERKRSFVSDLSKPVPYSEDIKTVFTPRKYMTDDQRFAARRPDVLVYETPVLEEVTEEKVEEKVEEKIYEPSPLELLAS